MKTLMTQRENLTLSKCPPCLTLALYPVHVSTRTAMNMTGIRKGDIPSKLLMKPNTALAEIVCPATPYLKDGNRLKRNPLMPSNPYVSKNRFIMVITFATKVADYRLIESDTKKGVELHSRTPQMQKKCCYPCYPEEQSSPAKLITVYFSFVKHPSIIAHECFRAILQFSHNGSDIGQRWLTHLSSFVSQITRGLEHLGRCWPE